MEDLINGWWVGGYNLLTRDYHSKSDPTTAVKICPKCNKCWQFTNYLGGSSKYKTRLFEYLVDFPSYGLNRTMCKKCRGAND